MGFFSKIFRRESKPVPLDDTSPTGLSYHVAYKALPLLAFKNMDKIKEIWEAEPAAAGPAMFAEACAMSEVPPPEEMLGQFSAVKHTLSGIEFYLLIHPVPEPVDYSDIDPIQVIQAGETPTLAPYFSCAAYDSAGDTVKVFVLGQAAIGDGTTLRTVSSDGHNGNLGPGPQPTIDHFIDAIWQR